MNREAGNLHALWHRFEINTSAPDALAEVRAQRIGKGEWDLQELLRHHEKEPVEEDDEIAMRDAFDDLLAFYGCVEIAAHIGAVPDPLPNSFRADAIATLGHQDVRRYYRDHYPLLLPDMLIARIAGVTRQLRFPTDALPLFMEFLHVNGILEDDPSVAMLLWFLDDGYHQGYGWDDTLKILSRSEHLIQALNRAPRRRNPAEQAVDGLRKFLDFCVAIDDLLLRAAEFPLFQARVWHYHAYWFRTIRGDVRAALNDALTELQAWSAASGKSLLSDDEHAMLNAEARRSVQQIRAVVRRLTGRTYGGPLTQSQSHIRRLSRSAAIRFRHGEAPLTGPVFKS